MPSSLDSTRRPVLDEPPTEPKLRRAPRPRKGGLASLSGSDSGPVASPDGEYDDADDAESSDLSLHPIEQMFAYTAAIEHYAKMLTAIAPEVGAVTQDYVTLLRQVVPQAAMAKMSNQPLGLAAGAGAAMSAGGAGAMGQPSGLGMLAGGAAGMGGGGMGGGGEQQMAMAPGGVM